ncbi:GH3 auxin-responsive promoter [Marinobacter halodurans]|uniref:GH3 auxin-responsive promoter n=2 Tax=Marinobacter halodurans TaxID=2528979 RepID=A0ABY1ZMV9_9GAMM|nr:GH3 auxin-responsive promoter [Marinobacter halodurans]
MGASASGHWLLRQLVRPGASSFRRSSQALEQVQRAKLAGILRQVANSPMGKLNGIEPDWSWESFSRRQAVTDYADWSRPIDSQIQCGTGGLTRSPVVRYQPTSGSSSAIKWIPYTRQFLTELDGAISPWLADLYRHYPGIGTGVHYWSLSWLPSDMRQKASGQLNDDMKLLSAGKRWLAGMTQAVDEGVALAPTSDDSLFATVALLASQRNLTALSVWSPTFALGLLDKLSQWREPLAEVLQSGSWGPYEAALEHLPAPRNAEVAAMLRAWDGAASSSFYRELWPSLSLVSAWDTAAAQPWALKLRAALPQSSFQGKGLWATEGVVTIPLRAPDSGTEDAHHVLAVNSHAYEFEDEATGRILPPWELERGQRVAPLLTTGSGLLRYRLGDHLEVTGFHGELPALRFLGRNGTTDMVGEKISAVVAQAVLDRLPWPAGVRPVVLLAASEPGPGSKPCYVLMVEAPADIGEASSGPYSKRLADALETELCGNFHYRLARNLGQLAPARCRCASGMAWAYLSACRKRGMIVGNVKVEALRQWAGTLPGADDLSGFTESVGPGEPDGRETPLREVST